MQVHCMRWAVACWPEREAWALCWAGSRGYITSSAGGWAGYAAMARKTEGAEVSWVTRGGGW
jgi:hypothetical protein